MGDVASGTEGFVGDGVAEGVAAGGTGQSCETEEGAPVGAAAVAAVVAAVVTVAAAVTGGGTVTGPAAGVLGNTAPTGVDCGIRGDRLGGDCGTCARAHEPMRRVPAACLGPGARDAAPRMPENAAPVTLAFVPALLLVIAPAFVPGALADARASSRACSSCHALALVRASVRSAASRSNLIEGEPSRGVAGACSSNMDTTHNLQPCLQSQQKIAMIDGAAFCWLMIDGSCEEE